MAEKGYDPHYGARPLNRLIQSKILNPVASHIISNNISRGDSVKVVVKENELAIETIHAPKVKKVKSSSMVSRNKKIA